MLHQGRVEGKNITRGRQFINEARNLGYKSAEQIEQLLKTGSFEPLTPIPQDPFIDSSNEAATKHYLQAMSDAIESRNITRAHLPDPDKFDQAVKYYNITPAKRSELRIAGKTPVVLNEVKNLRPFSPSGFRMTCNKINNLAVPQESIKI